MQVRYRTAPRPEVSPNAGSETSVSAISQYTLRGDARQTNLVSGSLMKPGDQPSF